jgi:putative sigma-54 modulation protein
VQIKISARHGHLSAQSQATIEEKVERILKFYDRVTAINVTVDFKTNDKPEVELVVKAEHHDDFVAHDQTDSLLSSIDSVVHKIEMQLRKHKEKITDHRGTSHKHMEVPDTNEESDSE